MHLRIRSALAVASLLAVACKSGERTAARPDSVVADTTPNVVDVHAANYFTTDLTAGNYMLVCFLPDAKDAKPHFSKGILQVVKVT